MIAYSPAPAIAAMIQRARRKIVAHFLVHHAMSAEDAVPFVPGNAIMRRQFEQMRKRGIVRDGPPGNFWLDIAAYQADRDRRHRRLVPIVIVLTLVAAGVLLTLYRG